MKNRKIMKY